MKLAAQLMSCSILALAAGCATTLPEKIGDQGLLVGTVSSQSMPDVHHGQLYIRRMDDEGKEAIQLVTLNRLTEFGDMLATPLKPGKYNLDKIKVVTSSYSAGGFDIQKYFMVPTDREVTIYPGKATNLGFMLYENLPKLGFNSFENGPYHFKNSEDTKKALRDRFPSLYQSLENEKVIDADITFYDEDKYDSVRIALANYRLHSKDTNMKYRSKMYVTGPMGTLASINRNKSGDVSVGGLIKTDTTFDLSNCKYEGTRAACKLDSQSFLLVENGKSRIVDTPKGVSSYSIHAFGDKGILLVDEFMRVHMTLDNGKTWKLDNSAQRQEPFVINPDKPFDTDIYSISIGKDSLYLFPIGIDGDEGSAVEINSKTLALYAFSLPKDLSYITDIFATKNSYFAASIIRRSASTVYQRSRTGSEWKELKMPAKYCPTIEFSGDDQSVINMACGWDEKIYATFESRDDGRTWKFTGGEKGWARLYNKDVIL